MRVKWCDKGADHAGPYYTVSAVAMEAGEGTRVRNRKRVYARQTLARLCAKCLNGAEFRLKGDGFFTVVSRDPAQD